MNTNQYKVSIYLDGKLDNQTMLNLDCLYGVDFFDPINGFVVIEMVDELGDRDIEALARIMQNRGFRFEYTEHCA